MTRQPQFVSTGKAAAMLGVDAATLWRWHKSGALTAAWTTPGGQLRWDTAAIRALTSREGSLTEQPPTIPEPKPVVAAIVTSVLGVLVGRRNDGSPPWTFIAGKIEPGESPADAAVREVKEEAGLEVQFLHIIGRRVHPKTGRTMIYLACTPTQGTDVFVGDEDELAEVRWINLSEADRLLPGLFAPVREYLEATLETGER